MAGLFLIDGAVPVNLVDDPEGLRRRLDTPATRVGPLLMHLVGMGYRLSPSQYADLTIALNRRRERIMADYEGVRCPVEMVLATNSAGETGERAARNNALWKRGAERLVQTYPPIGVSWLNSTHQLPFQEPGPLAQRLEAFVRRIGFSSGTKATSILKATDAE